MRAFIIGDMEGVSGIVRGRQTLGGAPMYDEGRRLYTEEINAAVRGARAGGAREIVVMDCHGAGEEWSFNSLVPDVLDEGCDVVVQEQWTEYTGFPEEAAARALRRLDGVRPYDPGRPAEIRVEYKVTGAPDRLRFRPGVERVDDRTIVSRADDWWAAWRQFYL